MNLPLNQLLDIKLIKETKAGSRIKVPAQIFATPARIEFRKSPFESKDEIKAMKGSKWHGFDDPPRKIWSVDNCTRNLFQLQAMMGLNPFEHFDKDLQHFEYTRPLMEHQKDMSDAGLTYHYQIWGAEMGTGKGGLPSTKVATPTGWTTLGEIQIGDRIINPDGGETKVRGVYRRGRMEMFQVTFSDGAKTVCSGDHLWNVRTTSRKFRGLPYETLETQEIMHRGLCFANGNAKHYIPVVEPVEYVSQPLPIEPYLVGYILGNGGLTGWTNVISAPDAETVRRLNKLMDLPLQQRMNSTCDYHIKDTKVNEWLVQAGLKGCLSPSKHVPEEYLYTSVENRLALLQGLCDSDGTPCHAGGVEYSTTSEKLCAAFMALVQSLGGTCCVSGKFPTYTYKGEVCVGKWAYRIFASFAESIMPFQLSRKAVKYISPTKYQPTRAIVAVESVGIDECICISVEAANGLYVTDDYIVTHNTLSAIEVMEKSAKKKWWWVAPRSGLYAVEREFKRWKMASDIEVEMMTYEGLVKRMGMWRAGDPAPDGVIFDESSRLKTAKTQRTQAAQALADAVRTEHGYEGYVILMSGTPSPKSPVDWWAQAEIAWPGFLREGTADSFKFRLGIHHKEEGLIGNAFWKLVGWRDSESRCDVCGKMEEEGDHTYPGMIVCPGETVHDFVPCKNEVEYLYERLKGLVVVKHKKDCLDLPDKRYRIVECKPNPSILRVAQSLVKSAPNTITGLTWLRELSSGFQYRDKVVGKEVCPVCDGKTTTTYWVDPEDDERAFTMVDMLDPEYVQTLIQKELPCASCNGTGEVDKVERIVKEVPCPKEQALIELLDENEECGRLVTFAAFTGSVDKVTKLCLKQGWDVVQVDGRGWSIKRVDGTNTDEAPLDYWANLENHPRVVFVANPKSGGMSLTLVEARMIVYWDNSFDPEARSQSEDRIHRLGMDLNKGATIVDLIHLPTDQRVLDVLRDNRRLELMSLGTFKEALDAEITNDGEST